MKLGTENRKETIAAAVLGIILLLVVAYEFMPWSSTNASTAEPATVNPPASAASSSRPAHRVAAPALHGKERAPQSLDPTLHLDQLALTEQIQYEGSGRNIFVAQADAVIPTPLGNGTPEGRKDSVIQIPPAAPPPPIPLKFFGFASRPGEPKKIFLSKDPDVFIAGEGEIVDRRYKVVRISATSVDVEDLVVSGPAQSIPLTQERPQ